MLFRKKLNYLQKNRLEKDYINALPIIKFPGNITVVDTEEKAEAAIKKINRKKVVGFDTESRPSFKKGVTYPISIMQFSNGNDAWIFQLLQTGVTDSMKKLLAGNKVTKIGIGLKSDIQKMASEDIGQLGGYIDLSELASNKGIIQTGARGLTARYMKHRLVKSTRTTNWAAKNLTEKQLVYAATDAWICLHIHPLLLKDNTDYRKLAEEERRILEEKNSFKI